MIKKIIYTLAAMMFIGGCTYTPFAPITVPNIYTVKPPEPKDDIVLEEELKKLHEPDSTPYKINSGDIFNISVYEHPELDQLQIIVTPDGYISVPLVGPVRVGGLSLLESTDLLKEKLSKYIRNPIVSLIPYLINGYNFTITGRVGYPGCYPISIGRTRLMDAIALARGLSIGLFHGDSQELADLDNAYISRDGKILPIDFRKACLMGDPLHNIPLKNGDYIYIPSVMNSTVALLGEVNNQTYVGYKEGMTLINALTFGKGLRETHSNYVKIIRGGMKNPVVYEVNIQKILDGKIMDFALQANDIIYVPPDGLSDWNIIIRKIMPSLQSINMLAGPFGNPSGYINYAN